MTGCTTVRAARWLLLYAVTAVPVAGQDVPDPAAPQPTEAAPATPAPKPTATPPARVAHRAAAPTLAAGVGGPLALAASAGVILGSDRAAPDECPSPRGWLMQAEAGLGGAKISGGPVFTYCYTVFGSLGAAAIQAAFVRTWGTPLGTDAGLSYVGGELDIGLIDWKVTLGLLKRTRGERDGANLLFTWGIARGF